MYRKFIAFSRSLSDVRLNSDEQIRKNLWKENDPQPTRYDLLSVEGEAGANLRQRFSPGLYVKAAETQFFSINLNIIQTEPNGWSKSWRLGISWNSSFNQYELTADVQNSELNEEQLKFWKEAGPQLRRGLKYLAEQTALRSPPEATVMSSERLQPMFEEAIFCATKMVQMYHFSDVTHGLFPNHTQLEIFSTGDSGNFDIGAIEPFTDVFSKFNERVARHVNHQQEFTTIDLDPAAQFEWLVPEILQGLSELSNQTGLWFEKLSIEQLSLLGMEPENSNLQAV